MRLARLQHKDRVEEDLSRSNSTELWYSIKAMTNMETKRKPLFAIDETRRANELNNFYLRFESDNTRRM